MDQPVMRYDVFPGTNGIAAPPAERFLAGLEAVELSAKQIDCLRTHLSAPGHSMTMAEMGTIVFDQPTSARAPHAPSNSVYARLGWKSADAMEVQLSQDDDVGLTIIGVFSDKLNSSRHNPLVMHESLVRALHEYGIKPYGPDEFAQRAGTDFDINNPGTSEGGKRFEKEVKMAKGSPIPENIVGAIDRDLAAALEGIPEEKRASVRRRAAWKAARFANKRRHEGTLRCDECNFDPVERLAQTSVKPRSALDVHHLNPLAEGRRLTNFEDFALLCPTCHRIAHLLLKAKGSKEVGQAR